MTRSNRQQSDSEPPEFQRIADEGVTDFRHTIATAMTRAAKKAKRVIDTDRMVITTRDDIVIVNAPILKPPGKASIFEYPMFVYLGVSGTSCAKVIPTGFYTVRVVSDPAIKVPQAHYVDSNGKTVLVNPVTVETRHSAYPGEEDLLKVGITLRSTQEQGRAGLVIVGTCRCVPHTRYGWVIVHTVVI